MRFFKALRTFLWRFFNALASLAFRLFHVLLVGDAIVKTPKNSVFLLPH